MSMKTGLRYPEEFKAEAVQLVRSFPEKSIRQSSPTSLASLTRL